MSPDEPDDQPRSPYPDESNGGSEDGQILPDDDSIFGEPSEVDRTTSADSPRGAVDRYVNPEDVEYAPVVDAVANAPQQSSPQPTGPRAAWDDGWEEAEDLEEWENLRSRSGPVRRVVVAAVAVGIIGLVVITGVTAWARAQLDPAGDPGALVAIEVPQGATTSDIARMLDDAEGVPRSWALRYYLSWKDSGGFLAGSYEFRENMAVWEAKEVLEDGPAEIQIVPSQRVLFIEGLTVQQIRGRMLSELPDFDTGDLNLAFSNPLNLPSILPADVTSLEGVLFPATYEVSEIELANEEALLRQMVETFEFVADDIDLETKATAMGFTPYQIVIIASMIEKEAQVQIDRPKIARVIYNRLFLGEPLGIDATTRFALNKAPGEPLTESDLAFDSPYNTRFPGNVGLPPGPIAAPGRSSLEAALNPDEGNWLFYVLTNEDDVVGAHHFSDTLQEHNEAILVCIEKELGC